MKRFASLIVLISLLVGFESYAQKNEMDVEAAKAYNEGNSLLKAGNYEGAVKQYDIALKTSTDYRIYYQKGIALKKQGKLQEAEAAFKSAIQSNPNFDISYNGLGGVYFEEGKYLDAADAFKKFGELTKNKTMKDKANEYVARSLAKLAEEEKSDGKLDKALEHLNEAIKYYSLDAAYITLAMIEIDNGNFQKAIDATDAVIAMKNSSLKGAAYYYRGLAYKKLNDSAKARENFELAKKDPQYKKLSDYELNNMK
ncbi:tetratricopeptide repeat protein [Melioribacteraceae bacterium 4301-Me]|uniref:tetratricopeptide repeat protein n=1 Tax=Pyranulibacter aquaticus TaxID=3163344 RepID=UPI003596845C